MRIVHTCLRYPPATGGVETYVQQLVERTRTVPTYDRDISESEVRDVRVLTSRMRTHGPISELNPELLRDDPPYIQRLFARRTPFISYPRLQALKYYLSHHKPDVIHGHAFWYHTSDAPARFAQAHGIPFVLNPYYYETDVRRKPLWNFYRSAIGRKTMALADAVITISPFEQQLIEGAGFAVKRLEQIPPGIDLGEFIADQPNPFVKRGIAGQVLLAVGRISRGKGLDDVVQALPDILRQQPNTQLAIAGEDFGFQASLQKLAKERGGESHVHFLGNLSREELIGAYQHADIFVHPSHYEAFGIVLAESLASKTPVVARNSTAIPYVAPHEVGGLLFSSHDQLVEHTVTLLKEESLRRQYGQNGFEHVANEFNWDVSIQKMTGLYEELASNRSAHGS